MAERPWRRVLLIICVFGLIRLAAAQAVVTATVETDPVPLKGDAADDIALWIHPTDPGLSTVIGTDKRGGGLAVYDLAGREIQYLSGIRPNNVDLRYQFPLGDERIALVGISNRQGDRIGLYRVDPSSRRLEDIAGHPIRTDLEAYGFCLYRSPNGGYYAFVTGRDGEVEQWQLADNGSGRVDGRRVRRFDVGSQTEGCVADDAHGYLYLAEEDVGIWKYAAEPDAGTARSRVDSIGWGGRLSADVEGLTLYYAGADAGYLIASSQGDDAFVVYRREGDNDYLLTFEIAAGNGIDRVSDSDGIDVTNAPLGDAFPQGLFVAQDGKNDDGHQNFKLVPWERIATAIDPPLRIDTAWDPRRP